MNNAINQEMILLSVYRLLISKEEHALGVMSDAEYLHELDIHNAIYESMIESFQQRLNADPFAASLKGACFN